MEPGEADWSSPGAGGPKSEMESSSDAYQRQESSSFMDNQSEHMYDSSNLGGEDDYMNSLGLYDGYDSYNDSGGTTDDEENFDSNLLPPRYSQTKAAAVQKKNFLNGKDGMATCEQCGSVGVRHAFYSKSKRFCSLSCSRSFATSQREGKPSDGVGRVQVSKKGKPAAGGRKSKSPGHGGLNCGLKQDAKAFDWGGYLVASVAPAAPVSCFGHVPLSDSWDQIGVGMKVEVANTDCDLSYPVYWIASVVKVAGYTALMRYEGFGNDASHDFWVSLVSPDVHPVGWCATIGKPLVPPQSIQTKYSDWKEFLVKRLTGSRTLPGDFHQVFQQCSNNHKLRVGMKLEVVNKMCVSAMRVAIICDIIGGRLRLNYSDSKVVALGLLPNVQGEGDEFWCHMKSPLIHPVGWSQTVGHKLHASQEYRNACLNKIAMQKYNDDDVSPDMIPKGKDMPGDLRYAVGMKLEAIDPLNLSAICVATVMKVLRNGYLMIGIDGSPTLEIGSDWFCYHSTSPCIFPVGFCEINNIDLSPPKGHKGGFKWFDYLKQTKSVAAPVKLFDKEIPKHGYRPGMKLEAVDLMEPRLICVATVTRIVGRLLRIHFDGWENEYDQWVDCQSPDIYPVGWCHVMKYTLEGPPIKENNPVPMMHKKKKTKNQIYKGPRKKRKSKPGLPGNPFPPGYRFLSSSMQDSGDKMTYTPGDKVRPPHMALPPEAVAANLPPLLDPDLPEPRKKIKTEPGTGSPMETSTSISPARSGQPHPADSLPTLSPKGGNVPDAKSASELPQGVKMEAGCDSVPVSSSGGAVASSTDTVNNNTASNANSDRNTNSASDLQLASGVRLNSSSAGDQKSSLTFTPSLQRRAPESWSAQDVCLFLSANDCGACSEAVLRKNMSGRDLLALSAEEEISLAGTKVGPSLRITQLLQQLRSYANGFPSPAVPAPMDTD
ncbi:MBT domain-containing protein 1-like isoform X1 [Littorina saxatilis]|uniref:MBT domain-containing protein 1-like isoform X1 n=1 Tax=Littorina saxatilis TaxID=31220 RepID=UPI0038B56772